MAKAMAFGLFVALTLSLCTAEVFAGGKEVTLTGKISCAKCELGETAKCQTAIQVSEGGKTVTYYLRDKGTNEGYHEAVCGGGKKDGTVTGVVSEAGGKKWITPSKVQYAEGDKESRDTPSRTRDYALVQQQEKADRRAVTVAGGDGVAVTVRARCCRQ